MKISYASIFLFMENKLSKQQIFIIILTEKLNFKLLIFLHKNPIIIINSLGNRGHRFYMVFQLLLLLFIIILIILFLLIFSLHFLFEFQNFLFKFFADGTSLLFEIVLDLSLGLINLI